MKKLLLITVIALSFYSCRKCAECKQTINSNWPSAYNIPNTRDTVFDACGEDLKYYEELHGQPIVNEVTTFQGGTVTIKTYTNCQ